MIMPPLKIERETHAPRKQDQHDLRIAQERPNASVRWTRVQRRQLDWKKKVATSVTDRTQGPLLAFLCRVGVSFGVSVLVGKEAQQLQEERMLLVSVRAWISHGGLGVTSARVPELSSVARYHWQNRSCERTRCETVLGKKLFATLCCQHSTL